MLHCLLNEIWFLNLIWISSLLLLAKYLNLFDYHLNAVSYSTETPDFPYSKLNAKNQFRYRNVISFQSDCSQAMRSVCSQQ